MNNNGISEGVTWVPIDLETKLNNEYAPKLTANLNACIKNLENYSAKINRYAKTALLTSCMHEKGWTLEQQVIVTT